jgi:hypothetical protein
MKARNFVFVVASLMAFLIVAPVQAQSVQPPPNPETEQKQGVKSVITLTVGEKPDAEFARIIKQHLAYARETNQASEVRNLELLLEGKVDEQYIQSSKSIGVLAATVKWDDRFAPQISGIQGCFWHTYIVHYVWGTNYHTADSATAMGAACNISSIQLNWSGSNYGTFMYGSSAVVPGTSNVTRDGYAGLVGWLASSYAKYTYGTYTYDVNVIAP